MPTPPYRLRTGDGTWTIKPAAVTDRVIVTPPEGPDSFDLSLDDATLLANFIRWAVRDAEPEV